LPKNCLWNYFYNTVLKIKHKLHLATPTFHLLSARLVVSVVEVGDAGIYPNTESHGVTSRNIVMLIRSVVRNLRLHTAGQSGMRQFS
jgi:hypothetical protein